MAIFTSYIIALLAAAIAYQFSEGKSKKKKYKIWGFTIMPPRCFWIGIDVCSTCKKWLGRHDYALPVPAVFSDRPFYFTSGDF
ncbi:hypothetical protein ERJ70_16110 [Sediminibacillus dalangtanensis]|uniref:Uncharacterized protein n=1 Tax=Sediminibacillus dalangtanensis TaxID=2729421 RepID=A0ABX7VUX2_9BACI|nr:hypothetical protein [Sediminibacillus dalangtanensis]QTN00680.1 hypothetical protein ERJ70_16110 [Sediminibacillus dalangtanensis]